MISIMFSERAKTELSRTLDFDTLLAAYRQTGSESAVSEFCVVSGADMLNEILRRENRYVIAVVIDSPFVKELQDGIIKAGRQLNVNLIRVVIEPVVSPQKTVADWYIIAPDQVFPTIDEAVRKFQERMRKDSASPDSATVEEQEKQVDIPEVQSQVSLSLEAPTGQETVVQREASQQKARGVPAFLGFVQPGLGKAADRKKDKQRVKTSSPATPPREKPEREVGVSPQWFRPDKAKRPDCNVVYIVTDTVYVLALDSEIARAQEMLDRLVGKRVQLVPFHLEDITSGEVPAEHAVVVLCDRLAREFPLGFSPAHLFLIHSKDAEDYISHLPNTGVFIGHRSVVKAIANAAFRIATGEKDT